MFVWSWFLHKSLKQLFSSAAAADLTWAVYWLSASKQITLSIVAIICRDAAAGLKCNSEPLEIISLPLFPFSSRRSVSSIFSANFNLLILIQQPNGFCNQSVLCKTGASPPNTKEIIMHLVSAPIPQLLTFFFGRVKEFELVLERCHERTLYLCVALISAQWNAAD